MGTAAEISGWIGMFFILLAYFLLSREKVNNRSPLYHALNLLGVTGVGVNVFYNHAWPVLALQIAFGCIAVLSLTKALRAKRAQRR